MGAGGGGVEVGRGGARVSDFFTQNPNLKKIIFGGVRGRRGGGEGVWEG